MDKTGVVLKVDDLNVAYYLEGNSVNAVNGVSFEVPRGTCFGLVGESGCGKTTVVRSILRLLPSNARLKKGTILLKGEDITKVKEQRMDSLRWAEMSLVTQSAMNALNPVAKISDQMIEIFKAHGHRSKDKVVDKCLAIFEMVGLNRNRFNDYPHQFSGGMRQRAVIAMAIALNPSLIIADEPTTALDVIMQAQILNLLSSLGRRQDISIMLITHNIAIVAEVCQTVGVMYAGRLMEYGAIEEVFNNPHHPYTMGLKGAFPSIKCLQKKLVSIPGSPPLLIEGIIGCPFAPRCPFVIEECTHALPKVTKIKEGHYVACHRYEEAWRLRETIDDVLGMDAWS
ncbi:MAG: ABC transporter ATP-binding protein [Deltaproteobacteria bacterium]|nr:ABC transporter ATP-binding protein [Deltaproteobacteria bacterium]